MVAMEKIIFSIIAVFISIIVLNSVNMQFTISKDIQDSIEGRDKTTVIATLKDQPVNVFNRYDYLFIGMSNNIKKDFIVQIGNDPASRYRVLSKKVNPKNVYEIIVKLDAFKKYYNPNIQNQKRDFKFEVIAASITSNGVEKYYEGVGFN